MNEALLKEVQMAIGQKFAAEWMPGDASNRSYARLVSDAHPPLILMVLNAPEAFKSEEVTGADESKIQELPFVTVARALAKAEVRVPALKYVDSAHRFMVLEDLGDDLLYTYQERETLHAAIPWYEKSLEELVRFQAVTPFSPAKDRRFTEDLLAWEYDHFVEYTLLKRKPDLSKSVIEEVRAFGKILVDKLVTSSYILCHRDFHSKNLMVLENEGRVGLIDFQDALMGPPTYDLASFLRDSYVRLSDAQETHLLKFYENASGKTVDMELYGLTSLQRNMKAVGRFFYIAMVKGRPTHLPYVKPTLERMMKTLREIDSTRFCTLLEDVLADELEGQL